MACILKIIYKPIQMLANKLNGKLGKCKIVPGVFTPEEYDEMVAERYGNSNSTYYPRFARKVKTSGNTVPTPAGQLPKNMNTNNFPNVPAASIATESPREDAENEEEEAERHFDTVYRCAFISWEVECFC